MLEPLAPRRACLCCPPKSTVADPAWRPHPGFGLLVLTCDGEVPEFWREFCDWPTVPHYTEPEWVTGTVMFGPRKGEPFGFWSETDFHWSLMEGLSFGELEDAVREDPDHDWRLEICGPLVGHVYQRQECGSWVCVENTEGFA